MQTTITVATPIERTPRVLHVEGLFDLPPLRRSELTSTGALPRAEGPWRAAWGRGRVWAESRWGGDGAVARVGSPARARRGRGRGQRCVPFPCQEAVEAWPDPAWFYPPAENTFAWRFLQRRPPIVLE